MIESSADHNLKLNCWCFLLIFNWLSFLKEKEKEMCMCQNRFPIFLQFYSLTWYLSQPLAEIEWVKVML